MADKERIKEGKRKGAFESPVKDNLTIAATNVKSVEKDYEITVGEEAIERLKNLGISEKADGTMTIPAHDTVKENEHDR